jgi:hypothetical protein
MSWQEPTNEVPSHDRFVVGFLDPGVLCFMRYIKDTWVDDKEMASPAPRLWHDLPPPRIDVVIKVPPFALFGKQIRPGN